MDSEGNKKGVHPKVVYFVLLCFLNVCIKDVYDCSSISSQLHKIHLRRTMTRIFLNLISSMHDYLMALFHADESKSVPLPGRRGRRKVEERKRVCVS